MHQPGVLGRIRHGRSRHGKRLAGWLLAMLATVSASAQQSNPVYVNESPRARELFQQLLVQIDDNAGEAARLAQLLLDGYADTLIEISDAQHDHFVTVRSRLMGLLVQHPKVLERYRDSTSAEAERLLEAGRIADLVRTRALTSSGLEALLRQAQDDLERARFRTSMQRLAEVLAHPDLDEEREAHARFMLAFALHYRGDLESYAQEYERLNALGRVGRELHAALPVPGAPVDRPDAREGATINDRPSIGRMDDLVAEPIWSMALDEALLRRRLLDPNDEESLRQAVYQQSRIEAPLATAAATVRGDVVFINEGFRIKAFDRYNGRPLWTQEALNSSSARRTDGEAPLDLNVIVVRGDTLVTLSGHAQEVSRSRHGEVVCLDPDTGARRWTQRIDRVGDPEDHEGLFPHGSPVLSNGLVILLARKVTAQLITSTYVVALDERDGSLVWSRYISSNGGLRQSRRPVSSLVDDDGMLVVSTAAGAIARLEAVTGSIQWLRRFEMPIRFSYATGTRQPWEFSTPVVTPRGIVAITPDQSSVVLIDSLTGETLETHAATDSSTWNAPRYLLANDHSVYAVSSDVRAFRLEMLERPVWRLPRPAVNVSVLEDPDRPGFQIDGGRTQPEEANEPFRIRGRIQLVESHLVVPTGTDILIVDDETGVEMTRFAVNQGGNPLTLGAQLFVAGPDQLDAYMSFASAQAMLEERMERMPRDPEPALNLAQLGLNGKDIDLTLDAASRTIAIAESMKDPIDADRVRRTLFNLLVNATTRGMIDTTDQGEQLFSLMQNVATTAQARVEQVLSYGDWLSRERPDRAVTVYQRLLTDPVMAETFWKEGIISRSGESWGIARIHAMLREHGGELYEPIAGVAERRLAQVLAQEPVAPRSLEQLAREYAASDVAVSAAVEAATRLIDRGDVRRAAGVLLATYRARPTNDRAEALLGVMARGFAEAGWDADAANVLQHVVVAHGNMQVHDGVQHRNTRQWLAELQGERRRADLDARPRIGRQAGALLQLSGAVCDMSHADAAMLGHDRMLMSDGLSIRCIESSELNELWSTPIADPEPRVLRVDGNRILLWLDTDIDRPRAVMLDATTGEELWTTPEISDPDLLGDALMRMRGRGDTRRQLPNGDRFDPRDAIVGVSSDYLVIAQRVGGVIVFDLSDGTEPTWSRPAMFEEIHDLIVNDHSIYVAGTALNEGPGGDTPGERAAVNVLDITNGTTIRTIDPGQPAGVVWMLEGPLGELAFGGMNGIETVDPFSGRTLWAADAEALGTTYDAWVIDRTMLTMDTDSTLRCIRFDGSGYVPAFDTVIRGDWNPVEVRDIIIDRDRIFAMYPKRVIRYNRLGNVMGADVLNGRRDYRFLEPCSESLLLVSGRSEQIRIPNEATRRTEYEYQIIWLAPDCRNMDRVVIPPIYERVERIQAMNGWLLMSTSDETVAIPFPPPTN